MTGQSLVPIFPCRGQCCAAPCTPYLHFDTSTDYLSISQYVNMSAESKPASRLASYYLLFLEGELTHIICPTSLCLCTLQILL